MKKRTWILVAGLAIATGLTLSQAQAEDGVWGARISLDGRSVIDIVDATESGCLAQVAAYREAIVIEPCHAVQAAAITDDNDWRRSPINRPRR